MLEIIVGFVGGGLVQIQSSPMGIIKELLTSHHHHLFLISCSILQYLAALKPSGFFKVRFTVPLL